MSVPDCLMVGDGCLDVFGEQFSPAGMGAAAGKSVLFLPCGDGFCGVTEKSCVLDVAVAHGGDLTQGAFQVVSGDVADAEELKTVFCGHDGILLMWFWFFVVL